MNTRKIIHYLILISILFTVIFNIAELWTLLTYGVVSQRDSVTPIQVKAIKDIFFLLIFILCLSRSVKNWVIILYPDIIVIGITILSLFSLLFSSLFQSFLLLIMGMRWFFPFLLINFLYDVIDRQLQTKISVCMVIIFCLALFLQLIEAVYLPHFWGINALGLNLRNPGIYLIPSSMAFFTLVTLWYAYHFFPHGIFRNALVKYLCPLSIFLTGSATGVFALAFFYGSSFVAKMRNKQMFILLLVILMIITFIFLPILTGRERIFDSFLVRLGIFSEVASLNHFLISTTFGSATNAAVLMNDIKAESKFIADSNFTAMLHNIGFIAMILYTLMFIKLMKKSVQTIQIFGIYLLFSITTIIFETFPLNLLFALNISYYLIDNGLSNKQLEWIEGK